MAGDKDELSCFGGIGGPNRYGFVDGKEPDQLHRLEIYGRGPCAYPVSQAEDRVTAALRPLC